MTILHVAPTFWPEYRKALDAVRAAKTEDEAIEARFAVARMRDQATRLHGHPTVDDIAELMGRVSDSAWAEGQIRHLQHTVDELRRERDSLKSALAQACNRPCGESGQ